MRRTGARAVTPARVGAAAPSGAASPRLSAAAAGPGAAGAAPAAAGRATVGHVAERRPAPPEADRIGPVIRRVGRSIWLPVGVLVAAILYLLGQRLLDRGRKLSHAGGPGEPDDDLIEI